VLREGWDSLCHHAALDSMSPPENVGKRTSVDIYEVVLDESF
jgi:hypothetical protein